MTSHPTSDALELAAIACQAGEVLLRHYAAEDVEARRKEDHSPVTDADEEAEAFRKRAAIPGFDKQPPEVREMSPSYRGTDPEGVARWKEIEAHAAQAGAVVPPLRTPNTDQKVASITTPILVIAGDVDLTTPSAAIRLWAKHLKAFDWALIPEAAHAVAWEQPDAFNQAVLAFLRKH